MFSCVLHGLFYTLHPPIRTSEIADFSLLPPVVEAGTMLAEVFPELRSELGPVRVVAPATHDTGSAVVSTPVTTHGGWGYISSGTWSLVGVELQHPVLTPRSEERRVGKGYVYG